MNLDATFRPLVIAGFCLVILIAVPFRIRSQATREKLDRTQEGMVMMIVLRLGGLAVWAGVIAFMIDPGWMAWSSIPLLPGARWAGLGLTLLTATLLAWTLRSLGPNLTDTVVTRVAHTLVTSGPYRWVRHPFYDCMALFVVSIALMMANWFVLVAGGIMFALLAIRSRTEEEKLLERFGEPYRGYRASTGRFLPRIPHRSRLAAIGLLWLVAAAGIHADEVDDFLRAEMKRQNIPGLSLAVLQHGKIIKSQGYGLANRTLNTPAAPDTVYKIASVSKQFIATGIMVLAQDGRLSVDDIVRKHLPDAPDAWSAITIRHLLTHTAGLVREPPAFDPFKTTPVNDLVRSAYPVALRFKPGDRWEYSNTGYNVLAEIITRAGGKPWTDFIDERVFKPSGMTSTWPTNTTARMPNRAQGYVDNDELNDEPKWLALRPGGAFLSTVMDLAKWDALLSTDTVLTEASRRQMWTPVTLNDGKTYPYGFGWMLGSTNGVKYVQHSGGMPGTRANMSRFENGLTIIMLMNLDDVDIEPVVAGVAARYLTAR